MPHHVDSKHWTHRHLHGAMETGRLLYDDGSAVPCGPTAEKTQRGWLIAGLAAGRLDARLHIRQEYFLVALPVSAALSI